jgi:sporulation protein YlmC with PRC-barrel domain
MNLVKGIRVSAALLVLFLLLLAGMYLLERNEEEPSSKLEETQIVDIHVGQIAAAAVSHGDVRFGLIHRAPGIVMEPPVEGEAFSQEEMQAFLYRLSKLRALGAVSRKKSLQVYGLDPPRARISLILKDGEKIRLALGEENPINESSYAAREGVDALYLISKNDAELFLKQPKNFRNRTILPKIEAQELGRIEEIRLEFESEHKEDFTVRNTSGFQFTLSEPFEYSLDYGSVLSELVFPLISLTPEAAMDETEVPEGISELEDGAVFRLKILLDQRPYTLSFEEGEDAYYVRRDDLSRVYKIAKEAVPWGSLQHRGLMKDAVYHINISEIDRILISSGKGEYALKISGQATALTGELRGKSLAYPELMDLFTSLFRTGIAEFVHGISAEDLKKTEDPVLQFQIFKKDGSIDELEYYERNESETYVSVNGKVKLSTYSTRVRALKNTIGRIGEKEEE